MDTPIVELRRRPAIGPMRPIGPVGHGSAVALVPGPQPRRVLAPNATLVTRIDLTPSVARFRVRPDAGMPPFEPGQYFALGLEVDGRFLQRPYSTASASAAIGATRAARIAGAADELEFLVRAAQGPLHPPTRRQAGPSVRLLRHRPGAFHLDGGRLAPVRARPQSDRGPWRFLCVRTRLSRPARNMGGRRSPRVRANDLAAFRSGQ